MIDFWGNGFTVAERMGILPAVLDAGYSVREVRFVDEQGRKAASFSPDVFRRMTKNRFTTLPRSQLSSIILQALDNRVETIFNDEISAIEQLESSVRVSFDRTSSRDFDLLIGADGLHSQVRLLTFGPESQFEKPLGYYVAAVQADDYSPRDELAYVCYTTPGRQVARFAQRDNRTMFLFIFIDQLMPNLDPHDARRAKDILRCVFEHAGWECRQILGALDQAGEIYFDRISQIRMNHWSNGRVMLIGDAAACISWLGGEGSGLAMTEAYVLAGELNCAGDHYSEAFRRYEQRMRSVVQRKQQSAKHFGGAFAPKTRFGVWFRNQVAKLLVIPAVADYFVGRDLRDDFDLPQYETPQLSGPTKDAPGFTS
jgi:2-polyprenyl-6-methoxyphenol hydroxylase-like FAD-dependent oxidoreductase